MSPPFDAALPADLQGRVLAAVAAVEGAARVARRVQDDVRARGAIDKADRSPVTVADFAAQALVARSLSAWLGAGGLVGEESSDALRDPEQASLLARCLDAARSEWPDVTAEALFAALDRGGADGRAPAFWTVDPIDGTKGFLRGEQYCVSLAFVEDAAPTVGALACPALDGGWVFTAARGHGAWSRPLGAEGPWTRVEAAEPASGVARVAESVEAAHSSHDAHAAIVRRAELEPRSVRLDSQTKYAVVARGQADVYLRLPTDPKYREKIWDHAAGALVASEAGLTVTDIDGERLDFGRGRRLEGNRGVIVAHPTLHARLLAAVTTGASVAPARSD